MSRFFSDSSQETGEISQAVELKLQDLNADLISLGLTVKRLCQGFYLLLLQIMLPIGHQVIVPRAVIKLPHYVPAGDSSQSLSVVFKHVSKLASSLGHSIAAHPRMHSVWSKLLDTLPRPNGVLNGYYHHHHVLYFLMFNFLSCYFCGRWRWCCCCHLVADVENYCRRYYIFFSCSIQCGYVDQLFGSDNMRHKNLGLLLLCEILKRVCSPVEGAPLPLDASSTSSPFISSRACRIIRLKK